MSNAGSAFGSSLPALPLAIARIAVAAAALVTVVDLALVLPVLFDTGSLRLPFSPTLAALGSGGAAFLAGLALIAALAVLLGVAARLAAGALSAALFGLLFLDLQLYSNHLYLVALLAALLAASECGAELRLWRRTGSPPVPAWPAWLMKVELGIVYAFAALAKVNPSFLSGEVIADHLSAARRHALGEILAARSEPVLEALAWATVTLELFLAFGLWWRPTRVLAASLGVLMHLAFALLLEEPLPLVAFGLATIGLYPLFFADRFAHPMR